MPFIWPVNRKISDFRGADDSIIREREFTFESVLFGESIPSTTGAIAKKPDFFYSVLSIRLLSASENCLVR